MSDLIENLDDLISKGERDIASGSYREAISCFSDVLNVDKYNQEARKLRAVCFAELKQYDHAIDDISYLLTIEKVEQNNKDQQFYLSNLHLMRGSFLMKIYQYYKAYGDFEKALQFTPHIQEIRKYIVAAQRSLAKLN